MARDSKVEKMTEFIVRRFDEWGVPQLELCKIEAYDELGAGEKVCGIPLTARRRPQMCMRADVRTVRRMNDHHYFFAAD
jgi:hypothetical protein